MALNEFQESNLGGICFIDVVLLEDVLNDSILDFQVNSYLRIYFSPNSARHSERARRNENGTVWAQKISLSVPKIRTELLNWLQQNHERYFVCVVKDRNGFIRRVGNKKKPLRLLTDIDTGSQGTSRNSVEFDFSGNTITPSLMMEYDGESPPSLITSNIMYESLDITLTAHTPLVYQMPAEMDLSTLICQFYQSNELVEVQVSNINNVTKQLTLLSEESVTIKMNAISKATS